MLVILFNEREGLIQSEVRVVEPARLNAGFCQQAEIVRKPESGTRGAICFQPIFQKRQPCFQLALQQQSRSAVECSRRVPEGKTLIRRDPYLFFTGRFGFRAEAAVLMQARRCDAGHIRD